MWCLYGSVQSNAISHKHGAYLHPTSKKRDRRAVMYRADRQVPEFESYMNDMK